MTADMQNRLRARFQLFDTDNSGDISYDELRHCLTDLDNLLTTAELDEMMKKCDVDGDGNISYEEFVAMIPVVVSPV